MTERVVPNIRGYLTWIELPDRARVDALVPKAARTAMDEYARVVARRDEVDAALRDSADGSPAMADAQRADQGAALDAMRKHKPAPAPVHAPSLRAKRSGLELERENLPVLANEALDRLDAA